ncbi:hypothetical protein SISNIDRAFT_453898 [Sistotremastrum niveocremeum HHB9708]|uniref:MYND-type domain-containing protein n=1 Tax=Sistotremastrum niveocremeum HHB9708 TaxID=1314777 RepID=A0A164VHV8_9AGAM|nr:hypothetical protein SISNIDRAFT_453898 [Sistotremastrum niveocremeum HHB9708]
MRQISLEGKIERLNKPASWDHIANAICTHLGIYLSSRFGYKQLHKDFHSAFYRLTKCWDDHEGNELVMGGIVTIFSRMVHDKLLGSQLHESGFIDKVLIAAKNPASRPAALNTLHELTHYGLDDMKPDIAADIASAVIPILENSLEHDENASNCISSLAHIVKVIFVKDIPVPPAIMQKFQVARILRLTLQRIQMRGMEISKSELVHAIDLITALPRDAPEAFTHNPKAVSLMAACLHSKSLGIRCEGLIGLFRLEYVGYECEDREITPRVVRRAQEQVAPKAISDAMSSYGYDRCDTSSAIRISTAIDESIAQCSRDGDLVKLGKALAGHFLDVEASRPSITNIMNMEAVDLSKAGLSTTDWREILPHCAKALRTENELDLADVLDLKYLLTTAQWVALNAAAQAAIARNPNVAFFYYVMSRRCGDTEMKWTQRGLNCKEIPSYIHWALLYRKARGAMNIGVGFLSRDSPSEEGRNRGLACLRSAYRDLKTFIDGAPPDSPRMLPALNRFVIVSIIVRGPELSPDLRELSDIMQKQALAEEFHEFFWGTPIPKTQVERVRRTLLDKYTKAATKWSVFIERTATEKTDDNALEESTDLTEQDTQEVVRYGRGIEKSVSVAGTNDRKIKFYCCSWCEHSSASMRKCSRCGIARYCGTECQKNAWKEHKLVCKSPVIDVC